MGSKHQVLPARKGVWNSCFKELTVGICVLNTLFVYFEIIPRLGALLE